LAYDFWSIMHYGGTAFSKNKIDLTIKTKKSCMQPIIGKSNYMSQGDIDLIKKMYKCADSLTSPSPPMKINGDVKKISSPNYPQKYPDYSHMEYPLIGEEGSWISLNFTDFQLESYQDCRYDSVMVRDVAGNVLMCPKCGNDNPGSQLFKTNHVVVIFHSDINTRDTGFQAEWKPVTSGAVTSTTTSTTTTTITSTTTTTTTTSRTNGGTIMTPNYPEDYPKNIDKEYALIGEEGSKISLTFTDFDLEFKDDCNYDWVMVKDRVFNVLMNKTCGDSNPGTKVFQTNHVLVVFHSDYSQQGSGFQAEWKQID